MLLQPLADLRRQQGDQEAALQLLRRQYQAERDDNPRSVATAAAITDLASVLQEQGAYDDARALLEEKLSILSVCTTASPFRHVASPMDVCSSFLRVLQ